MQQWEDSDVRECFLIGREEVTAAVSATKVKDIKNEAL